MLIIPTFTLDKYKVDKIPRFKIDMKHLNICMNMFNLCQLMF